MVYIWYIWLVWTLMYVYIYYMYIFKWFLYTDMNTYICMYVCMHVYIVCFLIKFIIKINWKITFIVYDAGWRPASDDGKIRRIRCMFFLMKNVFRGPKIHKNIQGNLRWWRWWWCSYLVRQALGWSYRIGSDTGGAFGGVDGERQTAVVLQIQ